MKKQMKKILSGLLCLAMVLTMLPMSAAAKAETETVTVTEQVRMIEEGEDGVCTSTEETVTKEYEIPQMITATVSHKAANSVSTLSLEAESDRYYTFTTFEDLKTLAAGSYSDYAIGEYVGEGALVITEDLVLPENVDLYVWNNEVIVPEGVTFTSYGWMGIKEFTINGTVRVDGLNVSEALTVNGILQSDSSIYVDAETVLTGEENVTFLKSWAGFRTDVYVETGADLEMAAALAAEKANWSYSVEIEDLVVLDRSVTLPENCDLHIGYERGLTVPAGCTLNLAGYMEIFGTVTVEGTLVNQEQISVYYDEGGILNFAAGSIYDGRGEIIIESENITNPAVAVPGLNLDNFLIKRYDDEYSTSWELQYIAGLTKLGTPTNLEWGYDHENWEWDEENQTEIMVAVPAPGFISWKPVEPTQAEADIYVYKVGQEEPYSTHGWHFGSMDVPEWRSIDSFCMDDPESGTYYFTVTSTGDGVNYFDSDTAVSDPWTYVKPDAKLGSCSNLTWDWPNVQYTAPADMTNVDGYEVEFYFSPTKDGEPMQRSATWSRYDREGVFSPDVDDWMIQDCGLGYYYFKVRALSDDITVACNGEWSELSPAYNLTELVENVENQLDNVISDSGSMTDDEIRDAVQSLDTTELKSAMLADQNVVDNIAVLEDQVGGAAPVEVTNDANAFDPGKVSIVGANLNNAESAEDPIKLVIDKPEKDHVIDAAYDNSVAVKFAMDLENVEDTENLAVPVKITLPIPANINPAFLVILHYHANGDVEEISMADLHITNRGGESYVSFVLTSFSDFIMTQYTQDTPPQEATVPMHRLYNPNSGEHFYTGSVEERDMLIGYGWQYEGVAWNAPISSGAPVYRLFNPNNGDHHYTMSWDEVEMLKGYGWQYEGVAWNSADANNEEAVPLYRLYNPNADCGSHHYTGSTEERDMLVSVGWIYEGIGWFGMLK